MTNTQEKIDKLWSEIEKAGSINQYVRNTLEDKGFMVKRRDTDRMSKTELNKYKKELKKEALEKSALKKKAWQAYKAHHIVHLGEGVYWTDDTSGDKWDLENASTHSHYERFEIPKRNGTMREIWAPRPKLKKAQRWVNQEITSQLLVHGAAHGFLAGRSIVSNATPHTDSKVIVKLDVENFFPSISWKRVKGVFRKAGYNEQVATLLALLCTESPRKAVEHDGENYFIALGDRCLPQGAPTSPALTNALCLSMDRRLTGIANKYGWRYSRYADDLTFSCPKSKKKDPEISHLLGSVQRVMGEEGFKVKQEKTRVIHQGSNHSVTGLVVNEKGTPRVNRKLKRQMRAAIHNLQQGKPLPEGESLSRLRGYAAFIMMTDRVLGGEMLEKLAGFE